MWEEIASKLEGEVFLSLNMYLRSKIGRCCCLGPKPWGWCSMFEREIISVLLQLGQLYDFDKRGKLLVLILGILDDPIIGRHQY